MSKKSVNILVLAFLTIFFSMSVACTRKDNLTFAERQELQRIFLDISLANSSIENFPISMQDSIREKYYTQIFSLHNITDEEYKSYIERLKRNPDQAQEVYSAVMDSLTKMNTMLEGKGE